MRWTVHGERVIYDSPWVRLALTDVEIPGGRRFEHHVVRMPAQAAGTVIFDPARGVLLLWRHRFVTDTWGWEIPAGKIDPGESIAEAAARETLEETGWRPGPLTHLVSYHPANGTSDQHFHIFLATEATHEGDPTDVNEAARIEWLPVERLRDLIRNGDIRDGLSLTGLSTALAMGEI